MEMLEVIEAKAGQPLQMILRGVVGFFDILIVIVILYDIVGADRCAVEAELIRTVETHPIRNLIGRC